MPIAARSTHLFASCLALAVTAGCAAGDPVQGTTGTTGGGDTSSGSGAGSGGGAGGSSGSTTSSAGGGGGSSSTSSTSSGSGGGAGGAKRVIGYFTAWGIYARNYLVTDVDADKLTHINYAFANVVNGQCALGDSWADVEKPMGNDDWNTPLRGNFHQLQLLKAAHPGLKTLISVGGWTWSSAFSAVAASSASRATFAASCVKFMKDYGFDGIDIDWEYPVGGGLYPGAPEDKANYTALLTELRAQLDAQGAADGGAHYQLSIAAPAGATIIDHLEVGKIHPLLDHVNLMAYDFHGTWESVTNHNAPLYASSADPSADAASLNIDAAVTKWLSLGAPADKLVLGMAFYGHGWQGVGAGNKGLYQPASGGAQGKYSVGSFDYNELPALFGAYQRSWDDQAKVPWLFDAASGTMISYDDAESLAAKAAYVKGHGLGGAMIWELSGDDAAHSLLGAVHGAL